MKTSVLKSVMVCLWSMVLTVVPAVAGTASDSPKSANTTAVKRILVVGLPDNVESNYFPVSMIAEETGIPADSVDYAYNQAVAENIILSNKDKRFCFLPLKGCQEKENWMNGIELKGDEEAKYADLSKVDETVYRQWMAAAGADYVLLLNQHYLKWQEKPLRTLFHITSYSLYDKNHREVTRGNHYFTSMELDNRAQLEKDSRKSSMRIAQNVVKSLLK